MASLTDLPELVGFFSYSREDDEGSHGALSALRQRIQHELRGQLGRSFKNFRLWQDKEAITSGTLWESEIKNAVAQSAFFIPIITPTVVASPYCRFELESFLAREAALGRDDLVFPILYIDVPALEDSVQRDNDPVLPLIAKRQYVDWRRLRHRDVHATDVSEAIERFCTHIRNALRRYSVSPEQRKQQEEAAAQRQAEAERQRQASEAERSAEEEARQRAAGAEQRRQEAADRRQEGEEKKKGESRRDAEAERKVADERRLAKERGAEEEGRVPPVPTWQKPRPALLIGSLVGVVLLGAIGAWFALSPTPARVTPAPLSAARERALKPGDAFQECSRCPVMKVMPAGNFTMGSPSSEPGRNSDEGPQHTVMIGQQFAVGQHELTFDEWDACVADGGCNGYKPNDEGCGGGTRPVINVNWDDANAYVAWLAKKTGKPYRLLSEAEYEYATRAGTTTAYPWGDAIGKNNANCTGCGWWQGKQQTVTVGSFAANGFGLYDMVGNAWERVEDCYHDSYNGAPTDGSTWTSGDCSHHVSRGGAWVDFAQDLRSASRLGTSTGGRVSGIGFRVGRTLLTR